MIEYNEEGVYVKLPYEAVDEIAVVVLKEGRDLVLDSIAGILDRVIEAGEVMPHHVVDLTDNNKYLDAFNTLLEYYGEEYYG